MKKIFLLLLPLFLSAENLSEVLNEPRKAAISMKVQGGGSSSVLLIDPQARAEDLVSAFQLLHREKPTLKLSIYTNEEIISNVIDLKASKKGTLLFLRVLSNKGSQIVVVPVEQVKEIGYSF